MADYCIDIAPLFEEISTEEICGPNLEYDPDFLELEQECKGKAEVQLGDVITPATDPDWSRVKRLSIALLERSRDLRVAIPLTRALLRLEGLQGFLTGLALIEGLLSQRWEQVHPQLDPDDDYDPLLRINTLSALCDSLSFLKDMRETVLVSSRGYGRFSLRDIDTATGEQNTVSDDHDDDDESSGISLSVIDAAFMDVSVEVLAETLEQLTEILETSRHIEQLLTEQVGVSHSIDLSALVSLLRRASHFVQERLERRTGSPISEDSTLEARSDLPEEGTTASSSGQGIAVADKLSTREDVIRTLDKLCEYYARHEPSSPVPLLLLRAKALVNKSFIEILEDLAPEGLDQIYQISRSRSDS